MSEVDIDLTFLPSDFEYNPKIERKIYAVWTPQLRYVYVIFPESTSVCFVAVTTDGQSAVVWRPMSPKSGKVVKVTENTPDAEVLVEPEIWSIEDVVQYLSAVPRSYRLVTHKFVLLPADGDVQTRIDRARKYLGS